MSYWRLQIKNAPRIFSLLAFASFQSVRSKTLTTNQGRMCLLNLVNKQPNGGHISNYTHFSVGIIAPKVNG